MIPKIIFLGVIFTRKLDACIPPKSLFAGQEECTEVRYVHAFRRQGWLRPHRKVASTSKLGWIVGPGQRRLRVNQLQFTPSFAILLHLLIIWSGRSFPRRSVCESHDHSFLVLASRKFRFSGEIGLISETCNVIQHFPGCLKPWTVLQ